MKKIYFMTNNDFILNHFTKIRHIQEIIFSILNENLYQNLSFQDFIQYLEDQKIRENPHEIKLILHLISRISQNHHRTEQFFYKIEFILKTFKEEMKKFFSNFGIFNIFKSDKRILLFLFEEGIIILDKTIYYIITSFPYQKRDYPIYFSPEIKAFKNDENRKMDENEFKIFEEKRKIGENDELIYTLIRKDSIDDFIIYINKTNFSVTSQIKESKFETNSFLMKNNEISLIEYAAFFGAIQIFNYLRLNNVELKPSLWSFAVHGNNPELIHILEENHIEMPKNVYEESIKCHHIDIMNYLKNYFFENEAKNDFNLFVTNLKNYNFVELTTNLMNNEKNFAFFYYCCKYDYFEIVEHLLSHVNINEKMKFAKKNISNLRLLL